MSAAEGSDTKSQLSSVIFNDLQQMLDNMDITSDDAGEVKILLLKCLRTHTKDMIKKAKLARRVQECVDIHVLDNNTINMEAFRLHAYLNILGVKKLTQSRKDCLYIVNQVYKCLAKIYHPDKPSGSSKAMQVLNEAKDQCIKHYEKVSEDEDEESSEEEYETPDPQIDGWVLYAINQELPLDKQINSLIDMFDAFSRLNVEHMSEAGRKNENRWIQNIFDRKANGDLKKAFSNHVSQLDGWFAGPIRPTNRACQIVKATYAALQKPGPDTTEEKILDFIEINFIC